MDEKSSDLAIMNVGLFIYNVMSTKLISDQPCIKLGW